MAFLEQARCQSRTTTRQSGTTGSRARRQGKITALQRLSERLPAQATGLPQAKPKPTPSGTPPPATPRMRAPPMGTPRTGTLQGPPAGVRTPPPSIRRRTRLGEAGGTGARRTGSADLAGRGSRPLVELHRGTGAKAVAKMSGSGGPMAMMARAGPGLHMARETQTLTRCAAEIAPQNTGMGYPRFSQCWLTCCRTLCTRLLARN